jgi:hypothetical protein
MTNKTGIAFAITGLVALLISAAATAADAGFYNLQLNYDKGNITLKSLVFTPGTLSPTRIQPGPGYTAELVSLTGDLLYEMTFEIPLTISIDTLDSETGQLAGGTIELDRTEFSLRIPYYPDGKTINIFNPDSVKVLVIDVEYLAIICGDGTCRGDENHVVCPDDCPSGSSDGICDRVMDGMVDPDCEPGEDPDTSRYYADFFLIIIAAIVIVFIVALFVMNGKKRM